MKFISVQKVNHSIFFIIKHHLNDFTFCYPFCQNALPDYISQKKHSY
ncbi:hypothetical protein HPNQ4216_1291 [Helicobacter pylori NQ4216]|nr:hypothetical protein HPNQ4216_1291 [Helicobacter pylori NQ4216]